MTQSSGRPLSLISRWFIRPGCDAAALVALRRLALDVEQQEPDTLMYLVHTPLDGAPALVDLPPAEPGAVLFVETYRDADAFRRHLAGPVFTAFVRDSGDLFVSAHNAPFTFVVFLERQAGFIRAEPHAGTKTPENAHPAVMFELIARDQPALKDFYQRVFGWDYRTGTGGFAYIPFPLRATALLGGIGQAQDGVPGFEPGHNFYLQVDALDAAVDAALAAGATPLMPPTDVDGYRFAMVRDPEGNPLGLIERFQAG